jgi:hypothetical protein
MKAPLLLRRIANAAASLKYSISTDHPDGEGACCLTKADWIIHPIANAAASLKYSI